MIVKVPFIKKIDLTPPQFIMLIYALTTVVSTSLLSLPWAIKPEVDMSIFDILFTTVSAITVTGLTVANTADTFTTFGSIVLAICMQIGGIGIMTLWTFVWMLLGKRIGLGYRQLIMIDQNRDQLTGLVKVMQLVFGFAIIIELIGVVFFAGIFYFRGYYPDIQEAIYYASFHSISAYTNGGFDVFGNSLHGFYSDYLIQTGTMVLIILGAIGFPVIIELYSYLHAKINKYNFRFSLFTKVTLVTFFLLVLFGMIGIWISEYNGIMNDVSWHEQLFMSLFNSVTVRSGGLSTINVSSMFESTLFLMALLMFIGASPSSVGGGIRTTTFATVIMVIRSYALGERNVHVFGKRLHEEDILKSFIVFVTGLLLILVSIIIISVFEMQQHSFIEIIFEVTSAFGTCGLSTGITAELTIVSKFILIGLMFMGRIGILAFLMSIAKNDNKQLNINYPVEKIIIG